MARVRTVATFVVAVAVSFAAGWEVRDAAPPAFEGGTSADPVMSSAAAGSRDARNRTDVASPEATVPRTETADVPPPASAAGSAGQTSHPRSSGAPNIRTAARFGSAIAAAYDAKHHDGLRPTQEDIDRAAQVARDRTDAQLAAAATASEQRIADQVEYLSSVLALRTARGILPDGPAVLELRVRGRSEVDGNSLPGVLRGPEFDPFAPLPPNRADGSGVLGGVLLPGREFVIERIEVEASLGRDRNSQGRLSVAAAGLEFPVSGVIRRLRVVLAGSRSVDSLSVLNLSVGDGSARVRFVGRVVPAGEGPDLHAFECIPAESEGLLRTDVPVRLQIVADHGGGNPRTLDLGGGDSGRFQITSERPVWDESVDLERLHSSTRWTENTGLVPPGFVFRVQRIEWRVRLLHRESHSKFDIVCRTEKAPLVDCSARESDVSSGTWTGDIPIRPGRESDLGFTCHYFGMADVTVYGRLEPSAR